MKPTGWKLTGDRLVHRDGGEIAPVERGIGKRWRCACGSVSPPPDFDDLTEWVAWRDQHKACAPRSKS